MLLSNNNACKMMTLFRDFIKEFLILRHKIWGVVLLA